MKKSLKLICSLFAIITVACTNDSSTNNLNQNVLPNHDINTIALKKQLDISSKEILLSNTNSTIGLSNKLNTTQVQDPAASGITTYTIGGYGRCVAFLNANKGGIVVQSDVAYTWGGYNYYWFSGKNLLNYGQSTYHLLGAELGYPYAYYKTKINLPAGGTRSLVYVAYLGKDGKTWSAFKPS